MRRESLRAGWFIYSGGTTWDNWAYPTEAAARATIEKCQIPNATVVEGKRQGATYDNGRQHSRKLLRDGKRK